MKELILYLVNKDYGMVFGILILIIRNSARLYKTWYLIKENVLYVSHFSLKKEPKVKRTFKTIPPRT
jgi:hypothetical protein